MVAQSHRGEEYLLRPFRERLTSFVRIGKVQPELQTAYHLRQVGFTLTYEDFLYKLPAIVYEAMQILVEGQALREQDISDGIK